MIRISSIGLSFAPSDRWQLSTKADRIGCGVATKV
jgi:hypothetical protein